MNWSPLFFLGLLIATATAGPLAALPEARTVSWQQLQPQTEFEDPYEKLDANQLIDLSILARVQDLEERDDAGLLTAGKRREAAEARARLEQQGIDIDGLLGQREKVDRLYLERASAAERSLEGTRIRLPGYLLPIQSTEGLVTEFLLVPWVGACIHATRRPANQS